MAKMKEHLSQLMKLQLESEKEQIYGWILRKKKVKWPMFQVKLKLKLLYWWKKEVLREIECDMTVHCYEPKQGLVLGEYYDGDANERLVESIFEFFGSVN